MIDYCAIGSEVWHTIGSDPTSSGSNEGITKQEIGFLDYRIMQWHRSLPEHLRYDPPTLGQPTRDSISPGNHRLRVVLYLRANNMRTHLYRPVLHSATSIVSSRSQAQTVVDVAKDTIRVLTQLNQTSTMYRASQALFNPFLTSALAVLFLAVSHTPALFAEQVREEFYMALELVRGMSRGSWLSKRLWKTIRVLKEVGPKLGLMTREPRKSHEIQHRTDKEDSSRSAALAMAGLAGHNVDELALYGHSRSGSAGAGGQGQQWPGASASLASSSPENMANDLTSLFEAAGGYTGNGNGYAHASLGMSTTGTPASNSATPYPMNNAVTAPTSAEGAGFGGEEELSRIMRDLF